MIYRADFRLRSLSINLVSPVVFANIARVLFEIMDEAQTKDVINQMVESKTLISDMLKTGCFPNLGLTDDQFTGSWSSLLEKRAKYRQWQQSRRSEDYSLNYIDSSRLRVKIDRSTGTAQQGILFASDEKFFPDTYSIYFYTENPKVIDVLEVALEIIEKTGLGNDISCGAGQVSFIRDGKSIIKKDEETYEKFTKSAKRQISIASTIITEDVLKDYRFIKYKVERYDGRTLEQVKPSYFMFAKGSLVEGARLRGPYLYEYTAGPRKIFIYNCVFPLALEMEGLN